MLINVYLGRKSAIVSKSLDVLSMKGNKKPFREDYSSMEIHLHKDVHM